jgi:hypothetical protein
MTNKYCRFLFMQHKTILSNNISNDMHDVCIMIYESLNLFVEKNYIFASVNVFNANELLLCSKNGELLRCAEDSTLLWSNLVSIGSCNNDICDTKKIIMMNNMFVDCACNIYKINFDNNSYNRVNEIKYDTKYDMVVPLNDKSFVCQNGNKIYMCSIVDGLLNCEYITELGIWDQIIASALSDEEFIIVSFAHGMCNVFIVSKDATHWHVTHKLELFDKVKTIAMAPNGHLVVLSLNGSVSIIVPQNDINLKLVNDVEQKWIQLRLQGTFSAGNDNCLKVFKNGTIIAGYKRHIMIWTPSSTTIGMYHSEKIEGNTYAICAIDQLDDERIVAVDVNGKVIVYGLNMANI